MIISPQYSIEDDDSELLGRFTAWMGWVVTHAAVDYLRGQDYRKREDSLEQYIFGDPSYEDLLPTNRGDFEFAENKLAEAFSKLTLMRRRILTLAFLEDLPAQEVADKLGCSVDYVYLHKHRALKKLRDQLIEGGDEREE